MFKLQIWCNPALTLTTNWVKQNGTLSSLLSNFQIRFWIFICLEEDQFNVSYFCLCFTRFNWYWQLNSFDHGYNTYQYFLTCHQAGVGWSSFLFYVCFITIFLYPVIIGCNHDFCYWICGCWPTRCTYGDIPDSSKEAECRAGKG